MLKVGDRLVLDDGEYEVVDTGPLMGYVDVSKGKRPVYESTEIGRWIHTKKIRPSPAQPSASASAGRRPGAGRDPESPERAA